MLYPEKKNAPVITDATPVIVSGNSTTKDLNLQAYLKKLWENLPEEFLTSRRFFPVKGNKVPLTKGWSNPENQKSISELIELIFAISANGGEYVGFDTSGHGQGDDYCLLDFDHVLDADGHFVNHEVESIVKFIIDRCGGNVYCEKSISKNGLHMLIKPQGNFPAIANGKGGVYYFDEIHGKNSPKVELFYKTGGRYVLLTGDLFEGEVIGETFTCKPNAPIPDGECADGILQGIIDLIQTQNNGRDQTAELNLVEGAVKPMQDKVTVAAQSKKKNFDVSAEYEQARIAEMIREIIVSELNYSDWLALMSACKNLGVPYPVVDAKNQEDSERYDAVKNLNHWVSLTNPSFGIETLHGLAKRFGYSEGEFRRQWYKDHEIFMGEDMTGENVYLSDDDRAKLFDPPHTDLYNAQRIESLYKNQIRFLTDTCRWYVYDAQKNFWVDGGKENSAILPVALDVANIISNNAESDNDKKLAKQWQARKTLSNAIEILKGSDSIRITERDLNKHKNLLNCQNGIVDLQTGKLYPHDSKYLLTQCINAEYRVGFHNDTVDKFLEDILPDAETRAALLRYLGYCLTGEVTEEKALFIHGAGGNGKGTLTRMLSTLFDDYACNFPIETILAHPYNRKDGDSATPAFNKLQWRRLAIAEEIPSGHKLDYAKFKILTGGDPLPIRKLYSESSEIKAPVHKMIFSGNHLPELDDVHDPGILRRWIQICFERDFTGANCDVTLKNRLQTPDTLSGLASLLVENAVAWYRNGLIISNKMRRERDNYFAENDFIAEFINQFCERGDGLSVTRKEFLSRLKAEYLAETRGKSDRELTSAIKKIEGIIYKRVNGGWKFFNIKLAETPTQENLGDGF